MWRRAFDLAAGNLVAGNLVAGLLLWAAPAAATPGELIWPEDGPPRCMPLAKCATMDDCSGTELCEVGYCVPANAVICTTTDANGDCPGDAVADPLPVPDPVSVCVPDNPEYCGTPRDCFVTPGDRSQLVRYPLGDCDRDGIRNEDETDDGAICERERFVGVVTTSGTCRRASPCERGLTGTGGTCPAGASCQDTGASAVAGGLCVYPDTPLHCCDNQLDCADSTATCAPAGQPFGLCASQSYCPLLAGPDAVPCFISPDSGELVESAEGDCDMDGSPNGEEENEGTDPCRDEADAGPERMDAGDAPPSSVDPRFAGGGGCVCRAGPSGASGGVLHLLAALGLGVMWARRRRRAAAR